LWARDIGVPLFWLKRLSQSSLEFRGSSPLLPSMQLECQDIQTYLDSAGDVSSSLCTSWAVNGTSSVEVFSTHAVIGYSLALSFAAFITIIFFFKRQ